MQVKENSPVKKFLKFNGRAIYLLRDNDDYRALLSLESRGKDYISEQLSITYQGNPNT